MQDKRGTELLARTVRARRHWLGMTLQELAARARVDRSVINRIELQQKLPQPETLGRLARALEVPLAELYAAAGYPLPELPPIRPYLRASYNLSETEINDIEFYLNAQGARYGGASQPLEHEDELPDN